MQKVINVLAVASFLVSGALAAGITTAYLQRETLRERVASEVQGLIEDAVEGAVGDLPSLMGGGAPAPSSPAGQGIPMPF